MCHSSYGPRISHSRTYCVAALYQGVLHPRYFDATLFTALALLLLTWIAPQVELIGHVQRQQMDNRYYTCMLYVKILGTPVYGFLPGSTQQGPASQPEPHLSPVASRESSQTQFGGLHHGDADSEVQQQSPGGVREDAEGDEEQKAVCQQQPPGKRVQYWGEGRGSRGQGGVVEAKGRLVAQQTLVGVAVMHGCFWVHMLPQRFGMAENLLSLLCVCTK